MQHITDVVWTVIELFGNVFQIQILRIFSEQYREQKIHQLSSFSDSGCRNTQKCLDAEDYYIGNL